MPAWLSAYLASLVVFLALDFAWFAVATKPVYRAHLGDLMHDKIALAPGALFYVLYAAALAALVVLPALARRDPGSAAVNGLLLGLAAYGAYNLTNASILKGWPTAVTVIDLVWGTFASALAGYIVSSLLLRFAPA